MKKYILLFIPIFFGCGIKSIIQHKNPEYLGYSKNITHPKITHDNGDVWMVHVDTINMINVKMHLSEGRNYGKYYFINLSIENFSNENIDFKPEDIYAEILNKKLIIEEKNVLTYARYMKKVRSQQNWIAALNGFSSGYNSVQSGHTTINTRSTSSNYLTNYSNNITNTNTNTNVTNAGVNITANPLTTPSVNIGINNSNTTTNQQISSSNFNNIASINTQSSQTNIYDAGAAYQARENERIKNEQIRQRNYEVQQEIKQNYLQRHTIEPLTRISGQINIKFKKGKQVKITIPINNSKYEFLWTTQYGQKLERKKPSKIDGF